MTDDASNIVGSAALEITVSAAQVEEAIKNAVQTAIAAVEKETKLTLGAAVGGSQTGGTGASAAGNVKGTEVGVDAKVNSVKGIDEAVGKALTGGVNGFQLPVDVSHLRTQIEAALSQPFKINLELAGNVPHGSVTGGNVIAGAATPDLGQARPTTSGQVVQPPTAFTQSIAKMSELAGSIHSLYASTKEAIEKAGKQFGTIEPNTPGKEFEKIAELTEIFGTNLKEWVREGGTRTNGVPIASGGTISDVLTSLGVAPAAVQNIIGGAGNQVRHLAADGPHGPVTAIIREAAETFAQAAVQQRGGQVTGAPSPVVVQAAAQAAQQVVNPIPAGTAKVAAAEGAPIEDLPSAKEQREAKLRTRDLQRRSIGQYRVLDPDAVFNEFTRPEPAAPGLRDSGQLERQAGAETTNLPTVRTLKAREKRLEKQANEMYAAAAARGGDLTDDERALVDRLNFTTQSITERQEFDERRSASLNGGIAGVGPDPARSRSPRRGNVNTPGVSSQASTGSVIIGHEPGSADLNHFTGKPVDDVPPRGPEDPEAVAKLRAQAGRGDFRESEKGLVNFGALQGKPGGVDVDLRPFVEQIAQTIRSGTALFKDESGRIIAPNPDVAGATEGEKLGLQASIQALSRSRRPFELPNALGIEGKVTALSPTAAVGELARAKFGGGDSATNSEIDAFVNSTPVKNVLKGVFEEARRAPAGDTSRGSGNYSSSTTPQAHAQATLQLDRVNSDLSKTLDSIDSVFERIANREQRGQPTERLQRTLDNLDDRVIRLKVAQADLLERGAGRSAALTPEEARAAQTVENANSAQNRQRILNNENVGAYEPLGTHLAGRAIPRLEGAAQRGSIANLIGLEEGLSAEEQKAQVNDALTGYFVGRKPEEGVPGSKGVLDVLRSPNFKYGEAFEEGGISVPAPTSPGPESQSAALRRVFTAFAEQLGYKPGKRGKFTSDDTSAEAKAGATVINDIYRDLQESVSSANEFALQDVDRTARSTDGGGRRIQRERGAGGVAGSITADRFTTNKQRARFAVENALRQGKIPSTSLDASVQDAEGRAERELNSFGGQYDPSNPNTLQNRLPLAVAAHAEASPGNVKARSAALEAIQAEIAGIHKPVADAKAARQRIRSQAAELISTHAGAGTPEQIRASVTGATGVDDAVRKEALEILQYRVPGLATYKGEEQTVRNPVVSVGGQLIVAPGTQGTRDPRTGTQDAEKFAAGGGIAPGDQGEPVRPFAALAGREAAAGGAGVAGGAGGGGGRGRTTSGGGAGGGSPWSGGPIHVIIDAPLPIPVSMTAAEGTGPGGGAANYQEAAGIARSKAAQQRADFRYSTNRGNEEYVQREIDRFRKDGKTDEQISSLFKGTPFANLASALGVGGGSGGAAGSLATLRRQAGLPPLPGVDVTSQSANSVDEELAQRRARGAAADRNILSRGFQASVTDIIQAPFFEKQQQAVYRYNKELGQLETTLKKAQTAQVNYDNAYQTLDELSARSDAGTKRGQGRIAKAEQIRSDREADLTLAKQQAADQRSIVEDREKELPGKRDAIRNLAVGSFASGGAVALGSVVFQLTSQLLGLAEEAVGTELTKLADRLTNFANTASQVGNQLSDAARGAGGNVLGVTAGRAGEIGLSSVQFAATSDALQRRVQIESSNKNLSDQADLLRASNNFAAGQNGPLQPGGGLPGLTRSTGGLFGTDLGATPDTAKLLARQLPGGDTDGFLNNVFPIASQWLGEFDQGLLGRSTIRNQLLSGGQSNDAPDARALKQFETTIAGFNENLEKGSSKLRLFTDATQEQADTLGQALKEAGADPDIIQRFQNLGIGVSDATGRRLSSAADTDRLGGGAAVAKDLLESIGKGVSIPNADLILASNTNAFKSQLGQISASTDLERRGQSASRGLQGLIQQPLSLEETLFGGNAAAAPDAAIAAFVKLRGTAKPVFDELNTQIDEGVSALREFGVSDAQINKIRDYGSEIHDIQVDMIKTQTELETRDFNRGLELAKRNLSDLVGLNGQRVASARGVGDVEASNLGIMENQVQTQTRQLQEMQWALAYRKLAFQTAVAGFGAQGLTGEERAARRQQAEYEAKVQKDMLDKQVSIGRTSNKIVDEQNLRALTDALYDIEKYVHDYQVRIELRGEAAILEALTRVKDKAIGEAQLMMSEFKSLEELSISTAAQIVKDTGESFNDVLARAKKTIASIKKDLEDAMGAATGTGSNSGPNGSPRVNDQTGFTTGTNGSPNVNANTGFTIPDGEPGGPGYTPSNYSGGGGSSATVVFTGDIHVRKDDDIDEIARKVEKTLNNNAALYGLRAPIGS